MGKCFASPSEKVLSILVGVFLVAALSSTASSQDYPTKAITAVVGMEVVGISFSSGKKFEVIIQEAVAECNESNTNPPFALADTKYMILSSRSNTEG